MARKCRFSKRELPPVKESNFYQKAGFFDLESMAAYGLKKAREQQERQKTKQAKAERAQNREAKERIKTAAEWRKEAQQAVNAFVRERDRGIPCRSCDKPDDGSHQRHASHYRSVKACSILRFDERNIYASCAQCNTHESGNLIEYRIRLIRDFGPELVDWLECQNGIRRYSIPELKAIKTEYKAKLKQLSIKTRSAA